MQVKRLNEEVDGGDVYRAPSLFVYRMQYRLARARYKGLMPLDVADKVQYHLNRAIDELRWLESVGKTELDPKDETCEDVAKRLRICGKLLNNYDQGGYL